MARTLSQDLRDRVIAAIEGGQSCRAAADRFSVSPTTAIRWRQDARQDGRAIAKPRGGDRLPSRIDAHGGFIRELVAKHSDMTLVEVQARLLEQGASFGISTLHRFFVRHGITRKPTRPSARPRTTLAGQPAVPGSRDSVIQPKR